MANVDLGSSLQYLRAMMQARVYADLTDGALLEHFVIRKEEGAFVALLGRLGPMVLHVCRRVLGNEHDAEDTFQATFLLLARHAAKLRKRASVAGWLHRVAYRLALAAREQEARRQARERRIAELQKSAAVADQAWHALQATLDEALQQVAEKYRTPLLLCYLEGKTQEEAARQLGCPLGTVRSRLARGRQRLQVVLERQGIRLSATTLAAALTGGSASAAVPTLLLHTTARAAVAYSTGVAPAALVSARAAALLEGGLTAMAGMKLKLGTALVLVAGTLALGAGLLPQLLSAPEQSDPAGKETPVVALQGRSSESSARDEKTPKPLEVPTDEKVNISGQVLGPEGKPFPGANLFLGINVPPKGTYRVLRATTGAEGRFQFAVNQADFGSQATLTATGEGLGPDWLVVPRTGKDDVRLRLVKDMPIEGRVLNLEGRPLAGVRIEVKQLLTSPEEDLTQFLTAGERPAPVKTVYSLRFSEALRALSKQRYRPSSIGILTPVQSDDDGRFRITGVGRERIALLEIEGPTIARAQLHVVCRAGVDLKDLTSLALEDRKAKRNEPPPVMLYGPSFEHAAEPTMPIEGIVRDHQTGKPVAGAVVVGHVGRRNRGPDVLTHTDPEGRYRLIGLPKAPNIELYANSVGNLEYLPTLKSLGEATGLAAVNMDFELARGIVVRGRVTDRATGKPIRASIRYSPLRANPYLTKHPGGPFWRNSPLSYGVQKDGSFSLLALPGPGVLLVQAVSENGEKRYMQAQLDPADRDKAARDPETTGGEFIVAAHFERLPNYNAYRLIDPEPDGPSLTCDISLDPGRTASGSIKDPDGKPLRGAAAGGLTAIDGQAVTLLGDSFEVIGLDLAHPRFVAFLHKERKLAGQVTLRGDEKEPVTVRLQPWGAVTGRVVDVEGTPLPGVFVDVYGNDRMERLPRGLGSVLSTEMRTGQDGRFRIEGIIPGAQVGIDFRTDRHLFLYDPKYEKMIQPSGTRDLGDVVVKPDPRP